MEVVKDMDRFGHVGKHRADIGRGQIGGHRLDAHFSLPEFLPEGFQGVGAFSVAHKDHRAALQIQDDGQIAMSFGHRDLIDGDLFEFLQVGVGKTFFRFLF